MAMPELRARVRLPIIPRRILARMVKMKRTQAVRTAARKLSILRLSIWLRISTA